LQNRILLGKLGVIYLNDKQNCIKEFSLRYHLYQSERRVKPLILFKSLFKTYTSN